MVDHNHERENGDLESPNEKLRKILQSRKKEQEIKPINEDFKAAKQDDQNKKKILHRFAADKNEIKREEKKLSDTRQIPRPKSHKNPPEKPLLPREFIEKIKQTASKLANKSLKMLSTLFKRAKDKKNLFKWISENPQGCLVTGVLVSVFSED